MNVPTQVVALLVGAAITTACSSTTGGAPVTQHATTSARAASPTTSVAAAPPSAALSDDDQIRQTIKAFQDAYNTENWDAYLDLMCAPMRAKFTGIVMDYLKKDRAQSGVTTVTSMSVSITGDTASVKMEARAEVLGSRSVSMSMKREEDGWKICQTYP
jgi:ketosteroid isomerase-like protein